jgi:hypothetical protein
MIMIGNDSDSCVSPSRDPKKLADVANCRYANPSTPATADAALRSASSSPQRSRSTTAASKPKTTITLSRLPGQSDFRQLQKRVAEYERSKGLPRGLAHRGYAEGGGELSHSSGFRQEMEGYNDEIESFLREDR